jgi:hypothetical protein
VDPTDVLLLAEPEVIGRIADARSTWGRLDVRIDQAHQVTRVVGCTDGSESPDRAYGGWWFRARPSLHATYADMRDAGIARIPMEAFTHWLRVDITQPERLSGRPVITHTPDAGPEWAGWLLTDGSAVAAPLDLVRDSTVDPIAVLGQAWPTEDLATDIVVVGAGSIGSAVAHALAMYGVRRLTLVDPDRLLWHNLVRHQGRHADVGHHKVDVVARANEGRWPGLRTRALRLDVIESADQMRTLFRECALVVCAADGVAARRVVSHLARRAEIPAVLACVLHDGAIGEVLRLRPWPGRGCLLCVRAKLVADGSMDPEPGLDSEYGTGTIHRPMTAVGSDLMIVGQLAAKLAIATLLEDGGHHDQRIDGEHAILGLRGVLGLPSPFDVGVGVVRWLPGAQSRSGCPTCGAA